MIERDLSQEKFAKELDINQTTVSQWLLGKKKPSYDNILAICVKFDITPNDFFGF
ncbi:MAG: helix-turn-helix transcriptional regulator [Clostridia bacterium]|nr:helix-turn-helix transcriptional regulator [Clostridia bacterium]